VSILDKPELLISAGSMEELEAYIDAGASAILIGESRFGMRLPGSIGQEELGRAAALAHSRGARLYVSANKIMDNDMLAGLPDYLRAVVDAGADALVFGDPAVLVALKSSGLSIPLHWNAEMTTTNYVTANYWATKGAVRAVLARELNMDQVLEFKRNTHLQIQVQVHGMTNIYHSKRSLVRSYKDHLRSEEKEALFQGEAQADRNLVLVEAERRDERFPVYEDENGTHIMSSSDICMLESLHELMEGGIDSLRIEGLLKSRQYNEVVLRNYRKAIEAYCVDPDSYRFEEAWLDEIRELQDPNRELSFGFFYKEQVY
jgi:U32 family peptidase